jgi:hypothetical protein
VTVCQALSSHNGSTWARGVWRYTILGKGVDGKTMKCVVEIDGNLIVVTVI